MRQYYACWDMVPCMCQTNDQETGCLVCKQPRKELALSSLEVSIGIIEMCECTLPAQVCAVFSQVIVHHSSLYL